MAGRLPQGRPLKRLVPIEAPPPRPRSAPTARPAWWDGVSHVVTRPARLDHLRAVGPLAFRWTTVFREPGGPTELKWSKQESTAMTPLNNLLCNRFGQVPAPSRPRGSTRTTVSEPLGAVAPVTPRDSRSAIPRPAGGRAGSFTALLHPLLRSFFSYSEGRRGAAKEKGRSRRKEGGARLLRAASAGAPSGQCSESHAVSAGLV